MLSSAQAQAKLSWAEWLYFQLIQPPPSNYTPPTKAPQPNPTRKVWFQAGDNLVGNVKQSR